MSWAIEFLGVGNGGELGASSALLFHREQPSLLIDCGPGSLQRHRERTGALPAAVFITHLHFDHIGDLEQLFYRACFTEQEQPIKVFVAAALVPALTQRVANYPGQLAEGGVNFWDVLQIVPVVDGFWWQQHYFRLYSTRHHQPGTSFCLHLPGIFFYSGDTRPIPEILHHYCRQGELIFHDCAPLGNPAHSGVEDILREYENDIKERLYAYHYHREEDVTILRAHGVGTVKAGELITLSTERKNLTGQPVPALQRVEPQYVS